MNTALTETDFDTVLPLNVGTLEQVADRLGIEFPSYNRTYDGPAVLHFGPSCFFMGALLGVFEKQAETNPSWLVDVVSIRTPCSITALRRQDGLHCVTESSPDGHLSPRICGAIRKAYFSGPGCDPSEFREVLRRLNVAPVVSFTVTPDGWPRNFGHEGLLEDVGTLTDFYFNPQQPGAWPSKVFNTVYGYMAYTLVERWRAGLDAPAFLMVENIKKSGIVAKDVLLRVLDQVDNRVAHAIRNGDWPMEIPIVMGDRIVAEGQSRDAQGNRVPSRESNRLHEQFGVEDPLALLTEEHCSFVVGCLDEFGMIPGTEAIRDLAGDVMEFTTPELAIKAQIEKLLFVNGAHAALALIGALEDHPYIDRTASMGVLNGVLERRNREVLRIVRGPDEELPPKYNGNLMHRFTNRHLLDKVTRVGRRISGKVRDYFMETIKLAKQREQTVAEASSMLVAIWIYYLHLEVQNKVPIKLPDDIFDRDHHDWRSVPDALFMAATSGADFQRSCLLVKEVLESRGAPVFPAEVIADAGFLGVFTKTLRELARNGINSPILRLND